MEGSRGVSAYSTSAGEILVLGAGGTSKHSALHTIPEDVESFPVRWAFTQALCIEEG